MTFIGRLAKIRWWLMVILVAVAPFHAFLATWIKSLTGNSAVSVWREAVVAIIGLLIVIETIVEKKLPKLDTLDWLILGYTAFSLIFVPFQTNNISQWMLGFRYDIFPFVFFFLARQVKWEAVGTIIKVALVSAVVVIVFGIIHALFLPQNFLTQFGYSMNQAEYTPDVAISACQYLEHTDKFCRAISTFGGPTRYGVYLMVILGLLIGLRVEGRGFRVLKFVLGSLALASIALTFSRSVWIGAFVMAVIYLFWILPKRVRLKVIIGAISLAVIGFSVIALKVEDSNNWNISLFKSVFVRDISTNQHLAYAKTGAALLVQHPLGMGLGTVGPASVRFEKLLTENWFLQIADEMGVIGIILFLAIIVFLSKKLLENKDDLLARGLFLSLIGICVTGLFTHSFEETTAVLILMGVTGMALSRQKN